MLKEEKDAQNEQEVDVLHRLARVTTHFSISQLTALQIDPNDLIN